MTQILNESTDQDRRQLNLSHDCVTAAAKQASNCARLMVVINDQIAGRGSAEETATALRGAHGFNLGGGESVLAHQPSAQVFRPRRFGVCATPIAKALVPALAVGRSVGAVPLAGALTALSPATPPVGEVGFGEFAGADAAGEHV